MVPLLIFNKMVSLNSKNSLYKITLTNLCNAPSLDSIPSPSPSIKIQIIGGKVYSR